MSYRRSSQPLNRGAAALSTQSWPVTPMGTPGANADNVGGWRQGLPAHQQAGHRTLRMEIVQYFHQNGCKRYGA